MKTKSLLNRKVQAAFASAILILLVVGAVSYRGIVVSNESDRLVRHSNEVLENLKDLVLAASEEDILKSYQLHANCYITRPVDLDGFLTVVKNIDSFWLSVVKLPHEVLA